MTDLMATYDLAAAPVYLAEQVILGAMIDSPPARMFTREEVFTAYPPEAFHGKNLLAAGLLAKIPDERLDPFVVLAAAQKQGLLARLNNGAYIHDLIAASHDHLVTSNRCLPFLVEQRRLTRLAADARRVAEYAERPDAEAGIAQARFTEAATLLVETKPEEGADLAAFMERKHPRPGWVVEGLLRLGERFLLTGAEGLGKSTLVRQFALACAVGLNPFTQTAIPQQRVLFIDLENPEQETQRIIRLMLNRLILPISRTEITMRLEFRPKGVNLSEAKDRDWLFRLGEAYAPDLVVLTPLYKLHRVDIINELAARTIVDVLDDLRDRTGAALLIEAHSPLTTDGTPMRVLRPYGSSVFLRWPEFGKGLLAEKGSTKMHRQAELRDWRGDRMTDRWWPERLCSGEPLPWIEDRPR